jgi:hypothetical protein
MRRWRFFRRRRVAETLVIETDAYPEPRFEIYEIEADTYEEAQAIALLTAGVLLPNEAKRLGFNLTPGAD